MANTTEVIRIETDTLDEAIAELQTLKDVLDGTRPRLPQTRAFFRLWRQ